MKTVTYGEERRKKKYNSLAPLEVFYKKTALENFENIRRKTPVLEPLFNKVAGLKKRLQHKCFPGNIGKFLRTPILQNSWKQLLLHIQYLTAFATID